MTGSYNKTGFGFSDTDMVDIPFDINLSNKYNSLLAESEDYTIFDYVHVQLYMLCADARLPNNIAVDVFESTVMKNHKLDEQNRKHVPLTRDITNLTQIQSNTHLLNQHLKSTNQHRQDYGVNGNLETDSELPDPTPEDFFIFFVESLERLSYFHTDLDDSGNVGDATFRGNQLDMPKPHERWLQFDNQLIKGQERIWNIPLYYDDERPVCSNNFIPTLWTVSSRFSNNKKLLRNRLRFDSRLTSLMTADPEFLNCLMCYPITSL
jgi:hypothetical protein